jgi:hypothetical protein
MTINTIIGIFTLGGALTGLIGLVLWSRWVIEHIDRTGPRSARRILQDLERDDQTDRTS